jgi:hypothetical protein
VFLSNNNNPKGEKAETKRSGRKASGSFGSDTVEEKEEYVSVFKGEEQE